MKDLVFEINYVANEDEVKTQALPSLPYKNVKANYLKKKNYYSNSNYVERILTTLKVEKLTCWSGFYFDYHPMMSNLTELNLRNYVPVKPSSSYNCKTELSLLDDDAWEEPNKLKVDLPHLKTLILFEASSFVDHIRSHKIETLKVAENSIEYGYSYDNWNWKFLETCIDLKFLHLQNLKLDTDLCDYGFKLSTLNIIDYYFRPERDLYSDEDDNEHISMLCAQGRAHEIQGHQVLLKIIPLIKAQKETLKKITLAVPMQMDPENFNFMIYDMNLEELNWTYHTLHHENHMLPMRCSTVKKLKLKIRDKISKKLLDIFKTFQAVEDLVVDFMYCSNGNEILRLLHDHMPNLKTLVIVNDSKLPSDEFKIILKMLTKLEELEFAGGMMIDDEIIALISQSNLRRITIDSPFVDSQYFEMCKSEKLKFKNTQIIVKESDSPKFDLYDSEEGEIRNLFEDY